MAALAMPVLTTPAQLTSCRAHCLLAIYLITQYNRTWAAACDSLLRTHSRPHPPTHPTAGLLDADRLQDHGERAQLAPALILAPTPYPYPCPYPHPGSLPLPRARSTSTTGS